MLQRLVLAVLLATLLCCPLSVLAEANNASVEVNIQVGDHLLSATLAENSTTEALIALLQEGPITIDMHDYASMEKVGDLPAILPRNDESINAEAGDLILYQGKSFVIYYDTNTWSLTRIGKIDDMTQQALKDILGSGDVTVMLSLPDVKR